MTAPDAPDDVLWESAVPGNGVVRTVIVDGVHAARFDDLNGDGREIEVSVFVRRDRTWSRVGHQDDVGIPAVDETPLFGWIGTGGWAVGRATPGDRVEVDWMGERAVVGVDAGGWWLAVVSGEVPEEDDELSWTGPRTRSFT
ncbi:hypothetical protein BJ993_003173 [Nocardioides aromaticivorans]|uniref:Uncharacterized protein n=1 Tax=Nocardioides aromaticivorans TaxID=200618 RepID=A0A7Z0CPB4_9ACTN|nr:hypothetical protein [Nocardioides aromaticivorans]NYI46093.1 hypothetical protein [Nocardioides aromaticivorans]